MHPRFDKSSQPVPVIAALGEVLWDVFPDARHPGGAPANVAFHACQLGAQGRLVSRVGDDEPGRALVAFAAARGLNTGLVQTDRRHPTGEVVVRFAQGEPRYHIGTPAAWDFLEWNDALAGLAATCDAVCVGSLAQREPVSRTTIGRFLDATRAPRLFDVNLRDPFVDREVIAEGLARCELVKMNRAEAERLAAMFGCRRPVECWLLEQFPIELVAITQGAAGCVLISRQARVEMAAPVVQQCDPVGAGDAFAAALLLGWLRAMPLPDLAAFANEVGAFVASRPGAMPELLPRFAARLWD